MRAEFSAIAEKDLHLELASILAPVVQAMLERHVKESRARYELAIRPVVYSAECRLGPSDYHREALGV